MCLSTVRKTAKGRSTKVLTGYKVFYGDSKKPFNLYYPVAGDVSRDGRKVPVDVSRDGRKVPVGKWLTAKSITVFTNEGQYKSGFHVYVNLHDAVKLAYSRRIILKVKYKGILASGAQCGEVVVAKHMFVPKQEAVKKYRERF